MKSERTLLIYFNLQVQPRLSAAMGGNRKSNSLRSMEEIDSDTCEAIEVDKGHLLLTLSPYLESIPTSDGHSCDWKANWVGYGRNGGMERLESTNQSQNMIKSSRNSTAITLPTDYEQDITSGCSGRDPITVESDLGVDRRNRSR